MQPIKLLILFALILTSVQLGGCGEPVAKVVPQDFVLQDQQQRYHSFAEHHGQWIVINFWASWCLPCLKELPDLQRFHQTANNAVVWGLNEENLDARRLSKFLQANQISYPIFPNIAAQTENNKRILREYFPIRGLPTTYLVNPKGEIVKKFEGEVTFQELTQFITNYDV